MGKDFQAGRNYNEHTGIKERLYLNCYTPVNIDKWFGRIQLKSEMEKKENEPLNPIIFSGLLYYHLLTVAPYGMNNMLYSSYAVAKYLQELKVLPEISFPLSKLMYDNRNECDDRMAEVRQTCNINQWILFYLDMLDKALGAEYNFIKEKHRCLDKSLDVLDKTKNVSNQMKERMKRELTLMYQKPVSRIEEMMNDCDITHSTAAKMVNLFVELELVKQVNDKQRYRVYEYIPLMESIQRI